MTVDLRTVPATAGRVRINAAAGRTALRVLQVTDAAARSRRMALAVTRRALALGPYRNLPRAVEPDWTGATPLELLGALRRLVPGFELFGLVVPRQPERRHLMVVGRATGTMVIAKVDHDHAAIAHEAAVLELLARRPIPSVRTPHVVGVGRVEIGDADASVMVTALVSTVSTPAFAESLHHFEQQLADRLSTLDRPAGIPEHWLPAHRDVTPWNLRRTGRGLALYDWEFTSHAPPGTDVAYYRACNAAMNRMAWPEVPAEVADHLIAMIDARAERGPDGGPVLGATDAAIRTHLVRSADGALVSSSGNLS